jgi:transposase InsO family protein/transposase-like protein
MRLTPEEKAEIIELVYASPDGINKTLKSLNINKPTFYNWCNAYEQGGIDALCPRRRTSRQWNRIPDEVRALVVTMALEEDNVILSSRELATKITDEMEIFISESSVFRILKERGLTRQSGHYFVHAADEFHTKTIVPNQMWQTDFTYLKIIGWGWYYLSTVIDDYSRYIVHWELCKSQKWTDVKRIVAEAMKKAKLRKGQAPILLSDNGPGYKAGELKEHLENNFGIEQIHGAPMHPQTQGKIERYHKTIKMVVKLHNYYCPEELKSAIDKFVDYYNKERYHESLKNCTPTQVYFGQDKQVLKNREKIKKQTLKQRKLNYFASVKKIA